MPIDTAGGQLANSWVYDLVNWKWDVELPPPPPGPQDYTMSVAPVSGTVAMAKSTTPINKLNKLK